MSASAKNMRRRYTLLLFLLAALGIGAAFGGWWRWGLFGMFGFEPRFADTVALLAAGEARQAGLDVYQPLPADPLGRPHVYGPGWLFAGTLGLRTTDATWVGALLATAFVAVAVLVLAPSSMAQVGCGVLLLCSPPVLLGISRGNNDLVVFLLLAAAAWGMAQRWAGWTYAGLAFLGVAGLLKMYPLVCLPAVWCSPRSRRARVLAGAAAAVACGAILWLWREDYRQAIRLAPSPQTTFAYGLQVTVMTWKALAGFGGWYIVAFVAGAACVAAMLIPRRRQLWSVATGQGFAEMAFVIGGLAWCFCFVAAKNFPYRFVLLLLPGRLWLEGFRTNEAGRLQLVAWTVVAWLDVAKRAWAPLAAADPTFTTPAWTWYRVVVGFEQGMVAGLSVGLAVGVVGALASRQPD